MYVLFVAYTALAYSVLCAKLRILGKESSFWNLMDDRNLGYTFGGLNQKISSVEEGSGAASHHVNAGSVLVEG